LPLKSPLIILVPLMFVIEVISHLIRPATLSIRLMANMFADHAVVGVFFSLIPLFVPVPLMLLGVFVSVVQALVFTLMSATYISLAIAHEEH
jgi:F-type H+-transporting ATPase subunit a